MDIILAEFLCQPLEFALFNRQSLELEIITATTNVPRFLARDLTVIDIDELSESPPPPSPDHPNDSSTASEEDGDHLIGDQTRLAWTPTTSTSGVNAVDESYALSPPPTPTLGENEVAATVQSSEVSSSTSTDRLDVSFIDPSDNMPTANSKYRRRRKYRCKSRVCLRPGQQPLLEEEFHYSMFPTVGRRQKLATRTGLSYETVNNWFIYRRALFRRQTRICSLCPSSRTRS
ncbi:homeobox protein CDX-1-like [Ptychodera flava]|uniref:homeobox protein CDX-1-like n=1 Tax=Ptychodera flava TaxID=63121 RepID=UPI003969C3A0